MWCFFFWGGGGSNTWMQIIIWKISSNPYKIDITIFFLPPIVLDIRNLKYLKLFHFSVIFFLICNIINIPTNKELFKLLVHYKISFFFCHFTSDKINQLIIFTKVLLKNFSFFKISNYQINNYIKSHHIVKGN